MKVSYQQQVVFCKTNEEFFHFPLSARDKVLERCEFTGRAPNCGKYFGLSLVDLPGADSLGQAEPESEPESKAKSQAAPAAPSGPGSSGGPALLPQVRPLHCMFLEMPLWKPLNVK